MEIDKLKKLLLDKNQIEIFEYIPKPLINSKVIRESSFY